MELKLVALLLISFTVLLHTVEAMPTSRVVNCCTRVSNKINLRMLKSAKSFEVQHQRACTIKAVILRIAHHTICIDPNNATLRKWMHKHQNKKNVS
ncbi:C-C motif chemokine 28-like [Stegostoma tigrinum]|uniref:C-C motif chemokine 28-like n=1 Tax=Stegostoma tigrinum TaxID=3053191 RepID=UPI00202B661E|nr:C-C motif chemokine 28-like [Stegostoma tigrinum]